MPRHRGWSALRTVAYCATVTAAIVIVTALITGCATSKEIELTQRVRDLEVHLAGKQDDEALLMNYIVEQETYIRQLQMGMEEQARMAARWRGNCDL